MSILDLAPTPWKFGTTSITDAKDRMVVVVAGRIADDPDCVNTLLYATEMRQALQGIIEDALAGEVDSVVSSDRLAAARDVLAKITA